MKEKGKELKRIEWELRPFPFNIAKTPFLCELSKLILTDSSQATSDQGLASLFQTK